MQLPLDKSHVDSKSVQKVSSSEIPLRMKKVKNQFSRRKKKQRFVIHCVLAYHPREKKAASFLVKALQG